MSRDLSDVRREYIHRGLREEDVDDNPVRQFDVWFQEVLSLDIDMANAMVLATSSADGQPSARYVLLKEYGESGFVFYTSSLSRKGAELRLNPHAALVLYWRELHRQVRIEGSVEVLPESEADRYFDSRPRGSRISAMAATQSAIIASREWLESRVVQIESESGEGLLPRPEGWLGYRVVPREIEFWQGQENRLHDRLVYRRADSGDWQIVRLAP